MEKKIIERINKNLNIIKDRQNYTDLQVESALYELSKSCVQLFYVKVLGDSGEFDFWQAVENKELEKCFKPLLLAKIKDTVKRYEKAERLRKKKCFDAYYKEDLIAWSLGIAVDAQRKINEFYQQT